MRAWLLLMTLSASAAFTQAKAQPRPQLSEAEASHHQRADYLGDWQPQPLLDAARRPADFIVAADGSGTHGTLQAAIDAVPLAGAGQRRYFIRLRPGIYRESVCVQDKAPVSLYGEPADAAAVTLVNGNYSAKPKRAGIDAANACVPNLAAATYGTAGSATLSLFSDAVHVAHLTISNDAMDGVRAGVGYPPQVGEGGGAQAVALMTRGDRQQLHKVRLLGHQDTFYAASPADALKPARVWVQASLIAGDVDFVFGNARLVIEDSEILSRAGRRSLGEGGIVLAPSTAAAEALGFLVLHSRFVAEQGLAAGSVALGRAWDQGVAKGAWLAGQSPNGQALVRDSQLGPHIAPWAPSTSRRPFASSGEQANRLLEYRNQSLP
ncbi:pectinesterase family protein [Paucibacter sp. B2R-40]|uniref:pectinesterase family protein n=1 Tax=Paucibacter sp. B2R-40 TaxID=2893554 RepID=UPI0021E4D28B|nr:pectinesterase family protein [Paucibacter sp. B2R-40]MCV2354281.1 pectinesterase family protein [Paucibacter sp. B2R-40]